MCTTWNVPILSPSSLRLEQQELARVQIDIAQQRFIVIFDRRVVHFTQCVKVAVWVVVLDLLSHELGHKAVNTNSR